MRKIFRDILITLVLAVVFFFLLNATIQVSVVVRHSMEPGLEEGQRLIINKAAYFFGDPARGDVVVLRPPTNSENYIKRIIALPGDTVEVSGGAVYINGTRLDEPYIKEPPRYSMQPWLIPEGEYFVLGDNRNISQDSHNGWTVPREDIIGKAWLSIWPLGSLGTVDNYPLDQQVANDAAG